MGWCLILEYAMASMAVSVSWSGYFNKFLKIFGVHLPAYLTSDPASYTGRFFNEPAGIYSCLLITALLVKGTKEAAGANNLIVLIKTSAVIFVIIAGAYIIFPILIYNAVDGVKNWKPFIPDQVKIKNSEGDMVSAYGIKGIISGAAAIFFAYIGFDAVSTQAGEAINPKKDVPFAIIASLLICTALYICVSLVLTGMMHYTDFNPEGKYPDAIKAPVAYAFEIAGKHWASNIVTIAATVGLISVVMVMMMGQSRIFIGMAKDGLIPRFFGELHPKTKTPYKGIILLGVIVAFIAAFTPISTLADMTSFGTLFALGLYCGLGNEKKEPNLIRPFKVPAYKIVVGLGVIINLYLIYNLSDHAKELSGVGCC
jgi:APA family basic amino acid/polyamine antiporter